VPLSARSLTSAGVLLELIRTGRANTRSELANVTGLARTTVAQRLVTLFAHNFVIEAGGVPSTGGRPPAFLAFNSRVGVILAADLGATRARLAVSDLAGAPLAERTLEVDLRQGPAPVLERVEAAFRDLLEQVGRGAADVRGVGIGVPAPIALDRGAPIAPPLMPGWNRFPIQAWFQERHDAPVLVDNDVNVLALGEHRTYWRNVENLLYVKVDAGIGCGIVAGGQIHRGENGGAGDIGHIRLAGHEEIQCPCGNVGCLEAVAGGPAIAARLTRAGVEASTTQDVVQLALAGDRQAVHEIRATGRHLAEVLAFCVTCFNPSAIIIGGDVAAAHEQLLAGMREMIFKRSLPGSAAELRVVRGRLGDRAGVIGAALMVAEVVLTPESIDQAVEREPARLQSA
jgi:predicted NBD/HSP70 family sugar kinase